MAIHKVTSSEFDAGLRGEPLLLSDGITRARHVVATGLKRRANELRATGDKSTAARLDQLETRVTDGPSSTITKGLLSKLKKEIAVVRFALVGTKEEDEDDEYSVGKSA